MDKLHKIEGVEIFSAGEWNGDEYTTADLDELAANFQQAHATVKPYLKLGHSKDQKLLQEDGLPAAGWVDRVYRQGEKLIADFVDIPDKIFDLIKKKAYRKVSCEIYFNISIKEKKFGKLLGGVALLGADMPGVLNLSDILSCYSVSSETVRKCYEFSVEASPEVVVKNNNKTEGVSDMPTAEELLHEKNKELAAEKETLAAKVLEFTKKTEAADAELVELKKFKAEAEAKEAKLLADLAEKEIETEISGLEKEQLITPAMKPFVIELYRAEKKEYTIKGADGKDVKMGKKEIVKELLKLYKAASSVNFVESSKTGDDAESKNIENKIAKYMMDNKCDYSAAYKAIMKEQKS